MIQYENTTIFVVFLLGKHREVSLLASKQLCHSHNDRIHVFYPPYVPRTLTKSHDCLKGRSYKITSQVCFIGWNIGCLIMRREKAPNPKLETSQHLALMGKYQPDIKGYLLYTSAGSQVGEERGRSHDTNQRSTEKSSNYFEITFYKIA